MSHRLCVSDAALSPDAAAFEPSSLRSSPTVTPPSLHYVALLVCCAFTVTLALPADPAIAGCNSGDLNNQNVLHGDGCRAFAPAAGATAVGSGAEASGDWSVAIGDLAKARGPQSTTVGRNAGPLGGVAGSLNIGAYSGFTGAGVYSTAIGNGPPGAVSAHALGAYSIALGGGNGANFEPSVGPDIVIQLNGARATGFVSMAFGTASQATGGGSSAFGLYSRATGNDSAAYGEFSTASGPSSIASGLFSEASGPDGIAAGSFSKAAAGGTIAIGASSSATGSASLALGRNASAIRSSAVAIGYRSVANVANTVSVGRVGGERRIMNVAAGVKATDAVNLAQLQAAVAAVASGTFPAVAPLVPQASPAVSVVPVRMTTDDAQRQLAQLEALVRQLQERIAQLESRVAAAAK